MSEPNKETALRLLLEDIETLRAKYLYALPDELRIEAQTNTANSAFSVLRHIGQYFDHLAHFRKVQEAERSNWKILASGHRWTEAEEEKLRALLLSGLPPHQIAKRLGRTTRAIRTRWLKLGLGRRQLLSLKMIERNKQHK